MLWVYCKIALPLTIVISAVAYAQLRRFEDDCRRIESVVQTPTDVQWVLSHRHEALERARAENRYLYPMLQELGQI